MSNLIFICVSCGNDIYPENIVIESNEDNAVYDYPQITPMDLVENTPIDNTRTHSICYDCMINGNDSDQNKFAGSFFNAEKTDEALSTISPFTPLDNTVPAITDDYINDEEPTFGNNYLTEDDIPQLDVHNSLLTYDKVSYYADSLDDGSIPPPLEN